MIAQIAFSFDGETFDKKRDGARLSGQLKRVKDLMSDGKWRTLEEISFTVRGTEAAVSARIRDLRKAKFGSHTVERKNVGGGVWVYRLVL